MNYPLTRIKLQTVSLPQGNYKSIWPLALSTIEYRARDKVTMEFKGGVPDGIREGCGLWGVARPLNTT